MANTSSLTQNDSHDGYVVEHRQEYPQLSTSPSDDLFENAIITTDDLTAFGEWAEASSSSDNDGEDWQTIPMNCLSFDPHKDDDWLSQTDGSLSSLSGYEVDFEKRSYGKKSSMFSLEAGLRLNDDAVEAQGPTPEYHSDPSECSRKEKRREGKYLDFLECAGTSAHPRELKWL